MMSYCVAEPGKAKGPGSLRAHPHRNNRLLISDLGKLGFVSTVLKSRFLCETQSLQCRPNLVS